MDPLDSRITMEMVIEQERKLRDIVSIASVTVKGSDTQNGPVTWEAIKNQMRLKTIALHRIIELIFKLAGEQFDMSRFPSRDAGPWEKLIRVKDLFVAIQRRFAAAKDSIELVHETSNSMKFMMKTGSEPRFPNTTMASNAIEAARILMRSRPGGVKLVQYQAVVWDLIRSAYLSTGGAGSEDVSETLDLLSDTRPVRVFMQRSSPAGSEDVSETLNLLSDTRPVRVFPSPCKYVHEISCSI